MYCSIECQRADRRRHRPVCEPPERDRELLLEEFRALVRCNRTVQPVIRAMDRLVGPRHAVAVALPRIGVDSATPATLRLFATPIRLARCNRRARLAHVGMSILTRQQSGYICAELCNDATVGCLVDTSDDILYGPIFDLLTKMGLTKTNAVETMCMIHVVPGDNGTRNTMEIAPRVAACSHVDPFRVTIKCSCGRACGTTDPLGVD